MPRTGYFRGDLLQLEIQIPTGHKYGGMEAADIRRLKELEDENRRLKQMFADLSLENIALKDVIEKKL